ncbi:MAG: response regulator transcription factor [Deltaproteobacteria bacterium]|nr:response regulator transcription factor [Candidatus Zymogenaceae bacterium]
MGALIAVLDDEPDIVELVSLYLTRAGFTVHGFCDSGGFFRFINKTRPDLVILDLMLPDDDGIEITKRLKRQAEFSEIPIIILSAKGEESDKIVGLELGAEDYVTKPFSPKELAVRVKKILSRASSREDTKKVTIPDVLTIDPEKYEVVVYEKSVDLTVTEFKILKLLATKRGVVFSRDQILDYLWGDQKAVIDRTIDMHIKNLRKKLGDAAGLIKNIRGIGYKLDL